MTDFLLELRSEEIPARMQAQAQADLARLFAAELARAGLDTPAPETYATPRRLALVARDLPETTPARAEELKGPRAAAPPQALEGFLRKTGLARDRLVERDGVLFARIDQPGRATAAVLAEAIPAIVRAFPWPKAMRWGAASASTASLRWVRPLQGIVALFGEEVVACEVDGIASGAATVGHRFHHPGPITIGSAADYADKLRMCRVILDPAERMALIRDGAARAAAAAGLTLIPDEGLVAENAGLAEWPVPLLGRFDPAFLDVPHEVIQLTMRTNQKYFACADGEGALAPAFVCVANIEAADSGAAIVAGNRKVLAARLADARFFWEQDLKVPLEEQAKKLDRIVFHDKLGTVAAKVERVAKLARWLVEEGIVTESPSRLREGSGEGSPSPSPTAETPPPTPPASGRGELAALAEQAARLCKADLVTGMVGEFPELQGVMGGYYAAAEGLDPQVAAAIRDHYGEPFEPVSVAVALADRLDTLASFFRIDERPTGSKDPFALRRAAIAALFMIMRGLRFDLTQVTSAEVTRFVVERWMVQNRSAGGRPDLIAAVESVASDGDLYRLGLLMRALESFVATDDGANLLAGYKRAANILKKEGWAEEPPSPRPRGEGRGEGESASNERGARHDPDSPSPNPLPASGERALQNPLSYTPEKAETALIAALDRAEPAAAAAVAREEFEAAMTALAQLRAPIDAFFEAVTVNDPDPARRAARLALLARVRAAVHTVADFSKIEG